jgi:hypothetical protein
VRKAALPRSRCRSRARASADGFWQIAVMRDACDDLDAARRRLLADVAENGLHVVHVPETPTTPAHSYSAGLWDSLDQPEVIVFGLDPEVAAELIEAVADEADAGRPCLADTRRDGLLTDYAVRFVAIAAGDATQWLAATAWAYDGAAFPAVQLVWPDKHGRWPWDEATREGFRSNQPVVGQRPPTP